MISIAYQSVMLGIFWPRLISGMKENSEGGTVSQKKLSRTLLPNVLH